jgi:hypothetical protein
MPLFFRFPSLWCTPSIFGSLSYPHFSHLINKFLRTIAFLTVVKTGLKVSLALLFTQVIEQYLRFFDGELKNLTPQ